MTDRRKYIINIREAAAFLIGLFTANNIIYCFVVGTTPIMLINVFATICLAIMICRRPHDVIAALNSISGDLRLTFLYITCSVLAMWVANTRYQSVGVSGYIALLLNIIVMVTVIVYKDHWETIVRGIFVGIIINFIFVLIEFVLYRSGNTFTLKELFPAFRTFAVQSVGKTFRPRGLFREPGHLVRYLSIFTLITWQYSDKTTRFWKYVFLIGSLLVFSISRSSSLAFFLVGVLVYLISNILLTNGKISKIAIAYSIIGVFVVGAFVFAGGALLDSIISGITDFSLDDIGNNGRILGMNSTVAIIRNNSIFGSGWNSISAKLSDAGFINRYVQGSYSVALELFAEIGIGSVFYYYFLLNKTVRLFKQKENPENIAVATSLLIYIFLFCATDYAMDGAIAVLLSFVLISLNGFRANTSAQFQE